MLAAACAALALPPAHASYKWLDEKGVTHFSENRMAERKNNCARAQRQLRVLSMERSVYTRNEKGERVYLEDKDRAAEAAEARREIAENCD